MLGSSIESLDRSRATKKRSREALRSHEDDHADQQPQQQEQPSGQEEGLAAHANTDRSSSVKCLDNDDGGSDDIRSSRTSGFSGLAAIRARFTSSATSSSSNATAFLSPSSSITPSPPPSSAVPREEEAPAPEAEAPPKPNLHIQSLSLDRGAIAPLLARPTAPFARSERKKACVSALYYSECFLHQIKPVDADSAAFDIQNQYTKWWIQSKNKKTAQGQIANTSILEQEQHQPEEPSTKKRRLDTVEPSLDEEQIGLLKERLIEHLQKTGGDTTTTEFHHCLEQLKAVYAAQQATTTTREPKVAEGTDGTWLALSKPTFSECQGRNDNGEYMYSLGRMSFDMFRPTHLQCSIRAVMNNIRVMDPKNKPESFPSRLKKEIHAHSHSPHETTTTCTSLKHTSKRRKNKGHRKNPIRHYE